MKRSVNLFTLFALCLGFTGAAVAQISINSESICYRPGLVKTVAITEDEVEVDLGAAGENQHWDFSAMETIFEYPYVFAAPDTCPGGGDFPEATAALTPISIWAG